MTQFSRIGLDTSKALFTLHCVDASGKPLLRVNLRRPQLLGFFKRHAPTVVAMEACGGSHHWARKLQTLGHEVRLIPPQYVKPYLKRGKNDRNDAEAICEAAGRPGMRFVLAKSVDQQAEAMVLKVRATLVEQRTQLINAMRGHAGEFGVISGRGTGKVAALRAEIAADTAIPPVAHEMPPPLVHRIRSGRSLPVATSRTRHSVQSEPACATPYANNLPFQLMDSPLSAAVPSLR